MSVVKGKVLVRESLHTRITLSVGFVHLLISHPITFLFYFFCSPSSLSDVVVRLMTAGRVEGREKTMDCQGRQSGAVFLVAAGAMDEADHIISLLYPRPQPAAADR